VILRYRPAAPAEAKPGRTLLGAFEVMFVLISYFRLFEVRLFRSLVRTLRA
jgi:hypothetical protein